MLDLAYATRGDLSPGIAIPHGAPHSCEELRVARVPPVHLDEKLTPGGVGGRVRGNAGRLLGGRLESADGEPELGEARPDATLGREPRMRPNDEEDCRGDEHTDRRGREGTRKRALPEHDRRERPDDDHCASEPAHRSREVRSRDGDNRRRDRDAQGGEGRVADREQGTQVGPLPLDDAGDDLAHSDHEKDRDDEREAECAPLRRERDNDQRGDQDRRHHVGDAPDRVEPVEQAGEVSGGVGLTDRVAAGDEARDQQSRRPEHEEHGVGRATAPGLVAARRIDRPPRLDVGDGEEAPLVFARSCVY